MAGMASAYVRRSSPLSQEAGVASVLKSATLFWLSSKEAGGETG